MPKPLNTKQLTKAKALSQQYAADQLETQVYRTAFMNTLGKLIFWVTTFFFLAIGGLMAGDIAFGGASSEKIGMFLHIGGLCTVLTGIGYYIFRASPRNDLRILEEALRLRQERDRGFAHFAAIGEAMRQKDAERDPPEHD